FKDGRVDEALEVKHAFFLAHRLTVETELDNVFAVNEVRRERARDKEVLRLVGMADADVAIGVDHILMRQDTVGNDEGGDDSVDVAHRSFASVCRIRSLHERSDMRGLPRI